MYKMSLKQFKYLCATALLLLIGNGNWLSGMEQKHEGNDDIVATKWGCTFKVISGNIADQFQDADAPQVPTDSAALVCPTNTTFTPKGATENAILEKSSGNPWGILQRRLKSGEIKNIPNGNVYLTTGGDLSPKTQILMAVVPDQKVLNIGTIIRAAYSNSLQVAAGNDITHLAFPSIGMGDLRTPPRLAIRVAVTEVHRFINDYMVNNPENPCPFKEIRFVVYNAPDKAQMYRALIKVIFGGKESKKTEEPEERECTVCFTNLKEAALCGDMRHGCCTKCLRSWVRKNENPTCPTCRQKPLDIFNDWIAATKLEQDVPLPQLQISDIPESFKCAPDKDISSLDDIAMKWPGYKSEIDFLKQLGVSIEQLKKASAEQEQSLDELLQTTTKTELRNIIFPQAPQAVTTTTTTTTDPLSGLGLTDAFKSWLKSFAFDKPYVDDESLRPDLEASYRQATGQSARIQTPTTIAKPVSEPPQPTHAVTIPTTTTPFLLPKQPKPIIPQTPSQAAYTTTQPYTTTTQPYTTTTQPYTTTTTPFLLPKQPKPMIPQTPSQAATTTQRYHPYASRTTTVQPDTTTTQPHIQIPSQQQTPQQSSTIPSFYASTIMPQTPFQQPYIQMPFQQQAPQQPSTIPSFYTSTIMPQTQFQQPYIQMPLQQQAPLNSTRINYIRDLLGISDRELMPIMQNSTAIDANNFLNIPEAGISVQPNTNHDLIMHTINGDLNCGQFNMYTIRELRLRTQSLHPTTLGRFNVVEGVGTNDTSAFKRFVDIGAIQANPENRDAVVQVASNFNGLETTDALQLLDNINSNLDNYVADPTQGPAASISAAPGLLLRRYFISANAALPVSRWGQSDENPFNLLRNVNKFNVTPAGYIRFHPEIGVPTGDDYLNIGIGYHQNINVTYGLKIDRTSHQVCADRNQLINQVFAAAVDFGATNIDYVQNPNAQKWAEWLILAAYEGIIRAAYMSGKKHVILTMVGCGVFGNDPDYIIRALNYMKGFIQNSGLNVTLVWYDSSRHLPVINNNTFRDQLARIVHETGGQYRQHSNAHPEGIDPTTQAPQFNIPPQQ